MSGLFANGSIVNWILGLTLAEAIGIVVYHRFTGRGIPPSEFLGNLLSGIFLLLALRAALLGAWWGWIAFWLLAALLTHLNDLVSRWR